MIETVEVLDKLTDTFTIEIPFHMAHAVRLICEKLDLTPDEYIIDCIRAGMGTDAHDNFQDYAVARMEPLAKLVLDIVDP